MNGVSDGLWIAACATAVAAVSLTIIGARNRRQRGWASWLLAMWLCSAGLSLAAWTTQPAGVLAAQLAMLQWPVLTLQGLRRFHARIDWPAGHRNDWSVLALCAGLVVAAGVWTGDSSIAGIVAPTATLVVHLYVAALLVCTGSRTEAAPMHVLGAIVATAGCVPMVFALPGAEPGTLLAATAAATAMATLAMAFTVTALVFERNERHLRASRRRLRALACIDALTHVPNRRHFEDLASRALAHDPPSSAVLMMFDVDHFKRINDQHGHAAGDRALRLVSRCLRDLLRVNDVPCRHGGDEFALLLRDASVAEAMRVASRLVQRLQGMSLASQLPVLSLSFGVVQVRPTETLQSAVRRADLALYEAKRQGRCRAVAAAGNEQAPVFTESQHLGLSGA